MLLMNEALLGGSLCPRLSFKPFDIAIFGRFACRCRNFVQSHVFHTPRLCAPYPGTPALHFPPGLAEAAMILTAALHKFLVRKRTFVTLFVVWCRLGKVNKAKSQSPTSLLHSK